MKNIVLYIVILTTFFSYSQTTIIDNWYKSDKPDEQNAFFNYKVIETDSSYITSIESKAEKKGVKYSFNGIIKNKKDEFKTTKSFSFNNTINDNGKEKKQALAGFVENKNDSLLWVLEFNDRKKSRYSDSQVISNLTLWHVLTTLNLDKKGRLLDFNSMEITELNYKKNHHLDYVDDEVLVINGKEINTKKVTQNGDGIRESTFWLDNENRLVKISIDNYKTLIICDDAEIKKATNNNTLIVTAKSGLSIRNKPSLSGKKIGKLNYEDIIEVIEKTNETLELEDGNNQISGNWIKIKIPETNKEGYAFGGYLNKPNDVVSKIKHPLKYRLQHLISNKMPVNDSIQYKSKAPSYVLSKTEWVKLGFNALEKFYESQSDESFIYNIYNVIEIDSGFILFIERYYNSESYHWLCLVDNNLTLKDNIDIAYDNAEGFTGTETRFKQEKIMVDYYNIYETPEATTTIYEIKNLQFKKVSK